MEDVQSQADRREIPLDEVGVSGLRYPITVLDQSNERQSTTAELKMSVNLPKEFKGTHMSRFIEVLNEHRGEITMRTLPHLLEDLKDRLEASSALVEVKFPYFVERKAPKSGATALMDYQCTFTGHINGGKNDFMLGVQVPVTSLCPCSKAISDYGAHNQRCLVDLQVRTRQKEGGEPALIWIEELVDIAEKAASAPVYPLLKRPDERHVTMQAFDNPTFVEDIVRDAAAQLRNDERVAWYCVEATSMESIHNHNAYARTSWQREG